MDKSAKAQQRDSAEPIRRASVVHHEPSEHGARPQHSALKVRRQSQSLKSEFSSGSMKSSNHGSSTHSRVKFDKVDVLEFSETVGHSVVPTSGPPVSLSQDEVGHQVRQVDEYEAENQHKQHRMFLKMSRTERERKLREQGWTSEEFLLVEKEVEEIRDSRKASARELESDLTKNMKEAKRRLAADKKKKKQQGLGRLNLFRRR